MILHELEYATRLAVSCALSPPECVDAVDVWSLQAVRATNTLWLLQERVVGEYKDVDAESWRVPTILHAPGEAVSSWPLMPLWRPTSWTHVQLSPRAPTSSWLHGTASFCVCQGISADFERLTRLRPLLVDTPASAYRAPTDWLDSTARRRGTAARSPYPGWRIEPSLQARCEPTLHRCEPSLHVRCDFCGRLTQQEETEKSINAHFVDHIRFYRMEQAIVDDDWKRLMAWLSRARGSFNMRDSNHYTPLHIAVLHRREKIALNLINSGAYVNAATIEGYTPLMLATRMNDVRMARMLLLHDAGVRAQSHAGVTALGLAIANRNEALVHMMLQHGAIPTRGRPSPYFHRALYMGPESIADAIWLRALPSTSTMPTDVPPYSSPPFITAKVFSYACCRMRLPRRYWMPGAARTTIPSCTGKYFDAWRGCTCT